jgi:hypothetical protein
MACRPSTYKCYHLYDTWTHESVHCSSNSHFLRAYSDFFITVLALLQAFFSLFFCPFGAAAASSACLAHFKHRVHVLDEFFFVSVRRPVDDTLCAHAVVAAKLAHSVVVQKADRGGHVQTETVNKLPDEVVAGLTNIARNTDVLGSLYDLKQVVYNA